MPSGATFNTADDEPAAVPRERRAEEEGRLRGLTQAEGIVMIVLGLLALGFPVVAVAHPRRPAGGDPVAGIAVDRGSRPARPTVRRLRRREAG